MSEFKQAAFMQGAFINQINSILTKDSELRRFVTDPRIRIESWKHHHRRNQKSGEWEDYVIFEVEGLNAWFVIGLSEHFQSGYIEDEHHQKFTIADTENIEYFTIYRTLGDDTVVPGTPEFLKERVVILEEDFYTSRKIRGGLKIFSKPEDGKDFNVYGTSRLVVEVIEDLFVDRQREYNEKVFASFCEPFVSIDSTPLELFCNVFSDTFPLAEQIRLRTDIDPKTGFQTPIFDIPILGVYLHVNALNKVLQTDIELFQESALKAKLEYEANMGYSPNFDAVRKVAFCKAMTKGFDITEGIITAIFGDCPFDHESCFVVSRREKVKLRHVYPAVTERGIELLFTTAMNLAVTLYHYYIDYCCDLYNERSRKNSDWSESLEEFFTIADLIALATILRTKLCKCCEVGHNEDDFHTKYQEHIAQVPGHEQFTPEELYAYVDDSKLVTEIARRVLKTSSSSGQLSGKKHQE